MTRVAVLAALLLTACAGKDGQFRAAWTLTLNGAPSDCANVGASKVEILVTPAGTLGGQHFRFPCAAGSGTTDALPPGDYDVSVNLIDARDDQPELLVELGGPRTIAGGDVVDLGTIPFDVEVHDVSLRLRFGATSTTNCATGAGGAKVTQQLLTVTRVGEQTCLGFNLSPGVGSCQESTCQESSVTQRLSGLPRGSYRLSVVGFEGAGAGSPCYFNATPVPFAIDTADVDLGTVTVPLDTSMDTAGCATPGCHCQ